MSIQATVAPRAGIFSVVNTFLAALALYAVVADAAVAGTKTRSSLRAGTKVSQTHVQVRDKDDNNNNNNNNKLHGSDRNASPKQTLTLLDFLSPVFHRPMPVLIGSCLRHWRAAVKLPSQALELPSTSTRTMLCRAQAMKSKE